MDTQIVEEYQKVLERDPGSRVFAALADAYREMGLLEEAEEISRRGVSLHHNYAPGYIALARILLKKNEIPESIELLRQATYLAADNVLAWQILGEALLMAKSPKEALRAHKMALFLNPSSRRSAEVVQNLESLTADEFAADLFEMQPLAQTELHPLPKTVETPHSLERELSVIDALIVRQKNDLARERLEHLKARYPGAAEIQSRWVLLGGENVLEPAAPLKPLPKREALVLQKKIRILKKILPRLRQGSKNSS